MDALIDVGSLPDSWHAHGGHLRAVKASHGSDVC